MKLRNIGYAVVIAMTAAAFVIGSAVPSDAKAKKKFEPVPVWETCVMVPTSPVCGARGGMSEKCHSRTLPAVANAFLCSLQGLSRTWPAQHFQ